ncbi:MAG TPA: hypothetical protein VFT89_00235 [Rhizobiaceae bacterium]|nr:hypothetical protein [Rhizobiaceae bacterium]
MKTRTKAILLGAAGVLLAGAPLQAQEETLSQEEVAGFFDNMQQTATEAVEGKTFDSLLEWTQNHLADGATLMATNEIYVGDQRKGFGTVSLNKEDVMRFGRMAVGMMSAQGGGQLEDYSLEIEVGEVTPIGPDAATVSVDYTETATLSAPPPQQTAAGVDTTQTASTKMEEEAAKATESSSSQTSQTGRNEAVEITARAHCEHVVQRAEGGGELVLGLSTCQARTEL